MDDTQRIDKLEALIKQHIYDGISLKFWPEESPPNMQIYDGYGSKVLTPAPYDDDHWGKYSDEELADIPKTLREAIDKLPYITKEQPCADPKQTY